MVSFYCKSYRDCNQKIHLSGLPELTDKLNPWYSILPCFVTLKKTASEWRSLGHIPNQHCSGTAVQRP